MTDADSEPGSQHGDVEIPAEDIDYAVENALWVAHSAITMRTSTALDYLSVFESQLVTHWRELEKVHWTEEEPSEENPTEQATLVTDGGIERTECWRCGYLRPTFESCPECGGSCKPLTKRKQQKEAERNV